ncbi:MAG: hypothetical protein HY809_08410 [Nitrospirae bacterium]|nr:hypothetical protein [Nitrospirota bacterium]
MSGIFRRVLFLALVISTSFISVAAASESLTFDGSTQFLWGDDLLNKNQTILAQYLRFGYRPEGKDYHMAGYGRVWDDFSGGSVREDGLSGRIYYLYLDYTPRENRTFRLGRQFVSFTAGASIIDGLSVDIRDLGPIGITLSGGADVAYSLESDHSKAGNYFTGIDIFLEKVESAQLGVSYVRKYDEGDRAREEFGLNARYYYKFFSPYAELRYDWLSKSFDEAAVGADFFPLEYLMIKAEYYHSYPAFDSTSVYSVFAVDRYQEYQLRAEYSFENTPLILSASYIKQIYEDEDTADLAVLGASFNPSDRLLISASVDYRNGYGGKLWGFEAYGDYTMRKELLLSAGVRCDAYRRPDYSGDDYAQSYWAGGKWIFNGKTSLDVRMETNINENFEHNYLGRAALNRQL